MAKLSIAELLPLPEKIAVGRGDIEVNGLDGTQIAKLLMIYKDTFLTFFGGEGVNFQALMITSPELVVDIIQLASDTSDEERKFLKKIPVAAQVECLAAIYRLSVPDEKKFISSLGKLLGLLKEAQKPQSKNSQTTSLNASTSSSEPVTDLKPPEK